MLGILGIVVLVGMVFGGYLLAGGKMAIILKSLPFEFMMIGGAAAGAFMIANDGSTIKHTFSDMKKIFSGAKWNPKDYNDLLCLLFELIRLARQNPVAIEEHIESPSDSTIFLKYEKISKDKYSIELICDTLRSVSMNYDDPHQVEDVLEKRLETIKHHSLHSSHALQTMADALPALGIVAAVLGVIKTMASIDQPPEVLGKLIGGALVGTFLGVFLAYGLAAPFAGKLKSIEDEDFHFYQLIREVLVANLHNHSTNICIEVGRQNAPSRYRPTFVELEDALKNVKQDAS